MLDGVVAGPESRLNGPVLVDINERFRRFSSLISTNRVGKALGGVDLRFEGIPVTLVTAGVIRDDVTHQYLVGQRGPGSGAGQGKWEFPGGKVLEGEGLEKCLARELDEELGIRVDIGRLLGVVEVTYDTRGTFRVHFFAATIAQGSPVAREHADLRWVGRKDLNSLDLSVADRDFVRDCLGQH